MTDGRRSLFSLSLLERQRVNNNNNNNFSVFRGRDASRPKNTSQTISRGVHGEVELTSFSIPRACLAGSELILPPPLVSFFICTIQLSPHSFPLKNESPGMRPTAERAGEQPARGGAGCRRQPKRGSGLLTREIQGRPAKKWRTWMGAPKTVSFGHN